MASVRKTYVADDKLGSLVEEASTSDEPVWIIAGDKSFRVSVDAVEDRRPDPATVARSIEGIRSATGGWEGLVPEDFKDYIAKRRRLPGRLPIEP